MKTPYEYHKIALGANNTNGLKTWVALNPPYFKYFLHPKSSYERRPANLDANQVYKTRGRDKITLSFGFWSPEEMDYFITTFFANDAEDVKVTIHAPDKYNQTWADYNADMQRPRFGTSMRDQDDNFYDVEITFRNLSVIP
jgi:hypothetical protein